MVTFWQLKYLKLLRIGQLLTCVINQFRGIRFYALYLKLQTNTSVRYRSTE